MIMKKFFVTFIFCVVSVLSFANTPTYFVKNIDTENMPIMDLESQENTEYWVSMFKFVQDAQKSNATKMVIKYNGKWKYVIPSPEALIQLDIIISHLCSGSSINNGTFEKGMKEAFEIAKKDKLIICVR